MDPHASRSMALRPARHLIDYGRRALQWPVASQQGSRRNAMLGATEIRARRHEQEAVEAFFASYRPPRRVAVTG